MSPEQIRGERLTQRSDVFSAGIMLWELLATRRLFTADAETERMQKILDGGYPQPSTYRPELSPELPKSRVESRSASSRNVTPARSMYRCVVEKLAWPALA